MSKLFKIDDRLFRTKKATLDFYCALCGVQRSMAYRARLSKKNCLQILIISFVVSCFLFPLMSYRSGFSVFFIWAIFETVTRTMFKKNIPCPHCGFDATLYKKDVREAKKAVEIFWQLKKEQNTSENLES